MPTRRLKAKGGTPPGPWPLVLVEWDDHHSGRGWRRVEEVGDAGLKPMRCLAVGWLVRENKSHIVLASYLSGDGANEHVHATGDMSLIRGAVRRVTVLRKAPRA